MRSQKMVCKKCKELVESRTNIVFGEGNPDAEFIFMGEAPGREEDLKGKPFIGKAGKLFTEALNHIGLKREDIFITNAVLCKPLKNRTPTIEEINNCSKRLFKTLKKYGKKIVCLGKTASYAIFRKHIEWKKWTYHPELKKLELQSYLRRGELDSAGGIIEDLLSNAPNDQSICLTMALLKIRQEKFAEADGLLNKLKNDDPNSLPVTVAQIQSKISQDKIDEAISICDETVNRFNTAAVYILRGRTFASLGQTEKAKKDLDELCETTRFPTYWKPSVF